ncbi:MAG: hypothetical protein QM608_19395 [Caulobacter sp.]
MRRSWLVGLAAALVLGAAPAARACSTVPGYVRPSNFELLQIADAVVVATPVSAPPLAARAESFDWPIRVRVTESLKGGLSGEVEIRGVVLGRTVRSDPGDVAFSHPEGHNGPCNRITLAKGGSYLLMLGRRGESLNVLGYPFSRVNEDYAGPDSPWSRMVRTYLDILRDPDPMARLARLEALKARLDAKPDRTPYEAMLARDIGGHLGSISPWKPTPFLLAAYDDLKAGRPPRYAPRDPAFDAEQSPAAAFAGLLMAAVDGDRPPAAPAGPIRDPRETAILKALIEEGHADAAPFFEAFLREDASLGDLGLGLRFLAANGQYRRAYDLIEARVPARLASASSADEAEALLAVVRDVQEDPYGGEPPRWRTDPSVAARWPRFSLALAAEAKARFGVEADFVEGPKTLLNGDYRADPALTLMLSGHANEIIEWARAELVRPEVLASPAVGGPGDPLTLPLDVTLRWYGVGDDEGEEAAVTRVFCAGPGPRGSLIRALGRSGGSYAVFALTQIGAAPGLGDGDRALLAQAAAAWKDREGQDTLSGRWLDDPRLARLIAGEALKAKEVRPYKPFRCPAA